MTHAAVLLQRIEEPEIRAEILAGCINFFLITRILSLSLSPSMRVAARPQSKVNMADGW